MENIAAYKPVSTSPPRSTCGLPERSSYCQPPSSRRELLACYQAFCVQDCPYRSNTPPFAPLLLRSHRSVPYRVSIQAFEARRSCLMQPVHRSGCVTEDDDNAHPGTRNGGGSASERIPAGSSSVLFRPGRSGCLVSPPSQKLGVLGSLTLAVWIKPSSSGEM